MTLHDVYIRYGKRALDFGVAVLGLVVLCPVLVILCLLLGIVQGWRNVFFIQERPGKDGRIFRLYKFQTMTNERDDAGNLLRAEERITRVGRWMRGAGLDELPQLWNIVRGEMSFVGPRPLLVTYLPHYSPHQARRHEVRPGLTGWAQCHGRNLLSWTEKFELDVWYVNHISLLTDLKVLLYTLREIVSARSSNVMIPDDFNGYN
jgi:lipopolysaccharide/colanic/teichoic acid biosynthesis glycosyltransferase